MPEALTPLHGTALFQKKETVEKAACQCADVDKPLFPVRLHEIFTLMLSSQAAVPSRPCKSGCPFPSLRLLVRTVMEMLFRVPSIVGKPGIFKGFR